MRTALAIALLLGCCGLDTYARFHNTWEKLKWWGQGDPVSSIAKRFEAIRNQLPARGFVRHEFQGDAGAAGQEKLERLFAKYLLAPLVVTTTAEPDVILDDDGTTVTIRGHDPHLKPPLTPKSPVSAINLLWLVWAWGLPSFAIFRLLKQLSRRADFSPASVTPWVWSFWIMGVSIGACLALSSALFTLWNIFCGAPNACFLVLESALWLGMLAITLQKNPLKMSSDRLAATPLPISSLKKDDRQLVALNNDEFSENLTEPVPAFQQATSGVAIVLSILLGVSLFVMIVETIVWNERRPDGIDDAIWIWNLRARSLHRSPGDWSHAFSPEIFHADYPLLLPASVARGWYYTDSESVLIPIMISDLFLLGLVTVLVSAAWLIRGPNVGCLLGIVVLSTPELLKHVMSQIADVPFAYFVAVTTTSWVMARRWPAVKYTAWLAFGVSLGAAVWLKNEGVTWAVLGLITVIAVERPSCNWRNLLKCGLPVAAGCSLPLLAWAVFHLRFPTTNDIIAGQGTATAGLLINPQRHFEILSSFAMEFIQIGPGLLPTLCLYCVLLGFTSDLKLRSEIFGPILLIGGQCLVYYLVYLTTPNDLTWHLSSSIDRVSSHLWPSAAFLVFMLTRSPAERFFCDAIKEQQRMDLETELRQS